MDAAEKLQITEVEYLEIDEAGEKEGIRYEFIDGEMHSVSNTTVTHNQIVKGVYRALDKALKETPCDVFFQGQRLNLNTNASYCYPDILVVCGKIETLDNKGQSITNPVLIMEVLSPSTKDFDLGTKAVLYRNIPTLKEYVCLYTHKAGGVQQSRNENRPWAIHDFNGLEYTLKLKSLNIEIKLADIYQKVDFILYQV